MLILAWTNRGGLFTAALMMLLIGAIRFRALLIGVLLCFGLAVLIVSGALQLDGSDRVSRTLTFLPGLADPGTLRMRLEFWGDALYLLREYQFTGVGLGINSVHLVLERYYPPTDAQLRFFHVHNSYLQAYLEQGLAGFLGFVGSIAVALALCWRTVTVGRDSRNRAVALSAGGAVLALVLLGITEIVVVTTVGLTLLFAAFGLLAGATSRDERQSSAPSKQRWAGLNPLRPARLGAAAALGACCVGFILLVMFGPAPGSPEGAFSVVLSTPRRMASAFFLNLGAIKTVQVALAPERVAAETDQLNRLA